MNPDRLIGLVPAAGRALRISPLPCSKELIPVNVQDGRPKVVSHYLLEKMRAAGISNVCIVLLQGKWDIPAYFKDGALLGMEVMYRVVADSPSVPHTLDRAYPFTRNAIVAFGFPDILFRTHDAFTLLLERQRETNADVVLGVFPIADPGKWDMVELDESGRVTNIELKPAQTTLSYGWSIAVWTPGFSDFLHQFVAGPADGTREWIVGDVIMAAVRSKLNVQAIKFPGDSCLDIGTPENLARAVRQEW